MTDERKYLVYDIRASGGDPADLDQASCLAMAGSTDEAKNFVREHDLEACVCLSFPVEDDQQGPPIIKGPGRWEWDWHRSTGFLTNHQDLEGD